MTPTSKIDPRLDANRKILIKKKVETKYDKTLDRLASIEAKRLQTLEIARVSQEQSNLKECTFTPQVNQTSKRFARSNQKVFESLHNLARNKQKSQQDQSFYKKAYKL